MATSERNGKSASFSSHSGHANQHANGVHVATFSKSAREAKARGGAKKAHTSDSPRARLEHLIQLGREIPRALEKQLKEKPLEVMASIGAGAFVLGALLGSKMGRIAIAAALPHAMKRIFEGALGDQLSTYAQELTGSVGGEADA